MDAPVQRKPRMYFDTSVTASNISFHDGNQCRNLPWQRYLEARWDEAEPDTIRMEIGGWLVVICGHNLGPVRQAIEEQTLLRIRAQADLEQDSQHRIDTFATLIRFMKAPAPHRGGKEIQSELLLPS